MSDQRPSEQGPAERPAERQGDEFEAGPDDLAELAVLPEVKMRTIDDLSARGWRIAG